MKRERWAKLWDALTAPRGTGFFEAFDRVMGPAGFGLAAIILIGAALALLNPWLAMLLWVGAGG